MSNTDIFSADKPINLESEDRFQRYPFSQRIAETIINRQKKESIVIGLYGAWGEGKTSVLNFIKEELSPHYPDIVQVTFNPWRFTDEATLLSSFFNTLANEIKKSLPQDINTDNFINKATKFIGRKDPLKTSTENIGDIIIEYSKSLSFFGLDGAIETFGKAISNVDIDQLKLRIEKLLELHKKKIVIIIDDIDRLDKNEIHAIFRLVKLTADFSYTTYLLSFDENMVSAAISDRFGAGDKKAGLHFLEKIIQIPIKLPQAQTVALKNYCFKLVEQALEASHIDLPEQEGGEFANKFARNYLIRLKNPRLAVRYSNSLSFSLPLLKGEVNYVDLLLIEGIKVLYPELYEFIREYPNYFLGVYKTQGGKNNKKIENFKTLFDEYTRSYSIDEIENAKESLIDLFPDLEDVWRDHSIRLGFHSKKNSKRISSTAYFNRYFSYAVIDGDVSDVAFDSMLEAMSSGNYTDKMDLTFKLIEAAKPDNFLQKLRQYENNLDNKTCTNLIKVLSKAGSLFPDEKASFFMFLTPRAFLAMFISTLIKDKIEKENQYETVKWIVEEAEPFDFAYNIFDYCRKSKEEAVGMFSEVEYTDLGNLLLKRAKVLSEGFPIWEKFNSESRYLIMIWSMRSKDTLEEYVKDYLESNIDYVVSLLKVYVGFIHSSASPKPYYGAFNKGSLNLMKSSLDTDLIYKKVIEKININPLTINEFIDLEEAQTEDNILRQFIYWYNSDNGSLFVEADIVE
jgi:predicted KAP-like P-loop ATPase